MICICGTKFISLKNVIGVIDMDLLLIIVIFEILTCEIQKTVWSDESLTKPSCSDDLCGLGHVEILKIKIESVFFC